MRFFISSNEHVCSAFEVMGWTLIGLYFQAVEATFRSPFQSNSFMFYPFFYSDVDVKYSR